ncbi:MAG: DevR family CRISPR-associated autoregulator [Bacteroidetes bacterium]|nr:DevR family CRISPR-associated autoregulator [Bacteroidota bacterium]
MTFAVKTQLNVHDLNNEAVAGNVTDIRIMEFLDEEGKRQEAPAVSGRMLKHWHYEGMRHLIINGSYISVPLCAGCKAGEPIRPGILTNGNLSQDSAITEQNAITKCVVCDSHGYLIAQPAATAGAGGISARRTSRTMFSWLMPVLDKINPDLDMGPTSKQVIHNRVSSDPSVMMPFNKSYASGIYAFVSALDVDRIGLVELNLGGTNPYAVDNNNGRKDRIKVAIEAYRFMLSGQIGASLSHAVPHGNPTEILVAYSEKGPLPFPVSPMYSDYISKTAGLMPQNTTLLYWGSDTPTGITKKNTIDEIFKELLSKVSNSESTGF